VAQCQRAWVELKLITGDHALTAHAIAGAAGIAHSDDGIAILGATVAVGWRVFGTGIVSP
jgi:magnesium-transporting ATPase (P-type)